MFNDIKCITLDLDDTLWPIEPTIIKAEHKLYEWLQESYPQVTEKYSIQDIAVRRTELSKHRLDIAHNVTALRLAALQELADEFALEETFADEGLKLFRQYRNQVEPFEQSEAILNLLKTHYTVGAITNGNAQMEHIPLGRYFDFVVTAAEVGACKPAPEMFSQAAKHAEVNANQIVHIGDSAQTDVLGALNAGCKAIWFNQKRLPWPGGQTPHAVIHCLSELPKLIGIEEKTVICEES